MKKWMKQGLTAALLGAALLGTPGLVSAKEAKPEMVGMPNPIVEYSSYNELAGVVGFHPLFFPACAMEEGGWTVDDYSAISGKLAQIHFVNKKNQTLLVRSEKMDKDHPMTDISGLYTDKWNPVTMRNTVVTVGKGEKGILAAHWTVGDYAFSVMTKNVKMKDFLSLLELSFLDVSEHFYTPTVASVAAK